MKQRFVVAFCILFALFGAGIGTSISLLWKSSRELRNIIGQHQVEELRQVLSLRIHRSQTDLEVSGTVFSNQLDTIIANVEALDRSVLGCFGCHHEPALQQEFERVTALLARYKVQYSTFITALHNPEQRQSLQLEAATTAQEVATLVDNLLLSATVALQQRTDRALEELDRSWKILASTLVLTFLVAVLVAFTLIRSVTGPVDKLVTATGRIAAGELGFRIGHREQHEFGSLMDAFNDMSATLESNRERINGYVGRLTRLNEAVLSLHATPAEGDLLRRLVLAMQDLVEAEFYGNVLRTDIEDVFVVSLNQVGETSPLSRSVVSARTLEKVRDGEEHSTLRFGKRRVAEWPFGPWVPEVELRDFLICWIDFKGQLRGALIAANKRAGEFVDEDGELLSALGHGVVEALENIHLYQKLRAEMEELKAQEAAKEPGALV
jgi:HAMP domain-containing protein